VKILLSAASFSSSISGLQRHAFNLAHCLLPRPEVTTLHIVVAPWQADLLPAAGFIPCSRFVLHIAEMGHSSLSRNLWHHRRLPELASSVGADIVHLTFPMPIHSGAFRCPTVVTLHDMYPYDIPLNFGFPKYLFNRFTLSQCLRSVDSVTCVSQATNLRLLHHAPRIAARKSVCIYNCVEAAIDCAAESPIPSLQSQPFLLCVAQHRRNKNIPLLIRTYARLWHLGRIDPDMALVIVGMTGPETARIRQLISGTSIAERIYLLEGLSDPELQWCYKHCAALVAPSIIEGFGLPVAEGLLAGARVVCSDIPAFREIGGGHCLYVSLDGNAERALADAIVTKLREPAPDPILLPRFSGTVLAGQYIDLYRRLIGAFTAAANARKSASLRITASRRNAL
jgi:glycosyltransferase involved in cell wall biosynthesis